MKNRRLLLAAVLASLLPLAAGAQTATLVRDISQGEAAGASFGNFSDPAAVPGKAFFSAVSGSPSGSNDNREMWASDGTAEGTFLLKDACPGPCGSEIQVLGSLPGALLWADRADGGRYYLWRSDGTRAGTYRPVDAPIRFNGAYSSYSDPHVHVSSVAGGFLYFATTDESIRTDALWRTDGTRTGTQLLHAFATGQVVETLFTDAGKVLLLVRQTPDHGDQTWSVWTTDGTPAGTRQVKALDRARPYKADVAGGHLFFVADAGSGKGYELWASDGTEAGTRPVTDFTPFSPFSDESYDPVRYPTASSGGHFFFVADDVVHGQELYESDGTPAGTRRITDFGAAEPGFTNIADLGANVVFTANDDLGHSGIWATGGDPASTRFLTLPCGSDCWEETRGFVKVGPRVVIFQQAAYGIKVLATDGTPAGTSLLRDGCPKDCDVLLPENLPAEADAVYFATSYGKALWTTDGTPAGTRQQGALPIFAIDSESYLEIPAGSFTLVLGSGALWALEPGKPARLVQTAGLIGPGTSPDHLAPLPAGLLFTACDGDNFSLWRSDGTSAGTVPAAVLAPPPEGITGCTVPEITGPSVSLGSVALFVQESPPYSRHKRLWRSDGTPAGTYRLTPENLSVPGPLTAATGRVYFLATHDDQAALWTSDGTSAGTVELRSWTAGGNFASDLAAAGSDLYFLFGNYDKQLWKSNGTPAGTQKIADVGSVGTVPASIVRVGSAVYLVSRDRTTSYEKVWRSDGTAAGTQVLGPVAGMSDHPYPNDLTSFQGALYFFAWTADRGVRGLWRSDGTAAGTVLLARFADPASEPYPSTHQPLAMGSRLFFVASDGDDPGTHGAELWATDGTAAGTRLVRDVRPGPGGSAPAQLTIAGGAGGRLYFAASEETYGRELWVTDGTEAGTRLVQDINPYGASSEPDHLTLAGNRLYFTADDGVSGRELWSLPLATAGCQPSPARLCLNGGRYQVEASWRTGQYSESREGHATAVPLSADTGYFWFFDPSNVEAVVKVLDGRGVNGHVWVFYGALSNVEYTITVTDTQTGVTHRYHNPQGQLASVGDTHGFGPLGAYGASPQWTEARPSPLALVSERLDKAAAVPCQAGAGRLCLNGGRFAVEVNWKDFQNHTGAGTAVPLTGDTGMFWFFNAANIELVVKVLDGRPVNNKFWVFYGALSNVEYTVKVTDTQTGLVRTYTNPSGRFGSVADTGAF